MSSFDIVIINGLVIDGTGCKARRADIGIKSDKITAINNLKDASARNVIDASKKIVCPGFIDTHSHSDLHLFVEPFVSAKVRQGVTTELIGQDGMSVAPIQREHISSWAKAMAGLVGSYDIDWKWNSVDDYLKCLEGLELGPNIAFLAPHCNIRMAAMGLDDRNPTLQELQSMVKILEEAIDEGAFGMSTGMIYPPCCYASIDEFVTLGKVLNKTGGLFVTHQRSEADGILESMDEILAIGRNSGCRIHFSHFKVIGKRNWDKLPDMMKRLDGANHEGLIVSLDQYPYVAGSTMLSVLLPPWAHAGGTNKLLERLKSEDLRNRMKHDIINGISGWDNYYDILGPEQIFVTFVGTKDSRNLVGKNLIEIGKNKCKDPIEGIFDLIAEEKNVVGMVDFYGKEEHVIEIMKRKEHNVCTDGIMGARPHPRLYGTFPRIISKYVREEEILDLERAIYKMTGKAAEVVGFKKRGLLKKGYFADLVVFDFENVMDIANYQNPIQYPTGIDYVIINGKIVVDNGVPLHQKAGRVIRK